MEDPTYVLMNGEKYAITPDNYAEMNVKTGETAHLFYGVGGSNLFSSFHAIGSVWDEIWEQGVLAREPMRYVHMTPVLPGTPSRRCRSPCRVTSSWSTTRSCGSPTRGRSQSSLPKGQRVRRCSIPSTDVTEHRDEHDGDQNVLIGVRRCMIGHVFVRPLMRDRL